MSIPMQKVFPGVLGEGWHEEMQRFAEADTVARLWSQDTFLWPPEEHYIPLIKSNLCWLTLPERRGY
jgi:hypothetical protein